MPHSQWCYVPWYDVPEPDHFARPGTVFASINQFPKISDECLALWGQILERLPEARLVVLDVREPQMRERLLERLQQHGVDAARVETRARLDILEYFRVIGSADIALDTFPYNGATTTLDALWMGVPVIGLRGKRGISRGTYSILKSLEAEDLIATGVQSYVDLNVALARNINYRYALRRDLRSRLLSSPLCDAVGFTRALEQRFRETWRSWCAGKQRQTGVSNVSKI
jgi:predicted O-linked N-acetylglucosamine transferase (SPINDLY family)